MSFEDFMVLFCAAVAAFSTAAFYWMWGLEKRVRRVEQTLNLEDEIL